MSNICYVIGSWSGERRANCQQNIIDPTFLLRNHLAQLEKYKHNLEGILVVNNLNPGEPRVFSEYLNYEMPRVIQNTSVGILQRPSNIGISYGAFSYAYETYRTDHDYYIFVEDDFCFPLDNFDDKLIELFNETDNCGYISGLYVGLAAIPHGITSSKVLETIWNKYGMLPYNSIGYGESSQIAFSNAFDQLGFVQKDMLSKYSVLYYNLYQDIILYGDSNKPTILAPIQAVTKDKFRAIVNGEFKEWILNEENS